MLRKRLFHVPQHGSTLGIHDPLFVSIGVPVDESVEDVPPASCTMEVVARADLSVGLRLAWTLRLHVDALMNGDRVRELNVAVVRSTARTRSAAREKLRVGGQIGPAGCAADAGFTHFLNGRRLARGGAENGSHAATLAGWTSSTR